jgi:biopolymer transport protein ExbD
MRFSKEEKAEWGIDLTPFIDVVLMLLLFFVVSTANHKDVSKLKIQLPQADFQDGSAQEDLSLEIGVDATGAYYVDGVAILSADPQKLKAILKAKLAQQSIQEVVLAGDKQAPHQAVVSALGVASELGMANMKITTQKS